MVEGILRKIRGDRDFPRENFHFSSYVINISHQRRPICKAAENLDRLICVVDGNARETGRGGFPRDYL